jgi:membrane protease YdiL (CAAX protease family)
MRHLYYITIYALGAAAFLYFLEQSIGVSYILKTAFKIVLFLIVPFVYTGFVQKERGAVIGRLKTARLKELWPGLALGLASFFIIIISYFILGSYVDFPAIATELETKLGITALNFIFIGLYITFVNSLLEEYFFRNFIFLNLFKRIPSILAYSFSSLLFAVYHMAIFAQWFNTSIMLICLLGLFLVGVVFNFMNSKSGHFLNSWLAHALADAAIILIGLRMFGVI